MPLNPDIKKILDRIPATHSLDVADMPVESALARLRGRSFAPVAAPNPVVTKEIQIPGPEKPLRARVYEAPGSGPFPVVVNYHGGGWVFGSLEQDDFLCHLIAARGFNVVSLDYRWAPEAQFPGPLEDCYAAAHWVAANAAEFGGSAGSIAVMGSSAGGNLAAGVSYLAREKRSPEIACQILIYPICGCDLSLASYETNKTGYHLTTRSVAWFWDQYAPGASDRQKPSAAPLNVPNMSGLPNTCIFTAEFDPLRDEGALYAERLGHAGVKTTHICFEGLIHGFFRLIPDAPWVTRIIDLSTAELKRAFHPNEGAGK